MNIGDEKRVEKIAEKIAANKELINSVDKGSIEIHFSGDSVTVSIKVVV